MKLIKVYAHGFKSFADPITLTFDGGVAGIVGPNGSGKSNINDAIKWVLGERSAKELRGDNMEDVIFAGSKTAKPLNQATVTLTFDNRNSNNNINHEFVTISRVLERGNGTNRYYINGEECRQRDIKDIAMETGIGKSSLAIISQGTVSDIAEATPEERKGIFEEVAGVSKFKFRKVEAIRKLEKTEAGLEQIRIIIAEIDKKLGPLRRQAEKAKLFIAKSDELKSIEVAYLVENIKKFQKTYESLSTELEGVSETRNDLENRISEYNLKLGQNVTFKTAEEEKLRELNAELEKVRKRLENLNVEVARETEKQRLIASGEMKVNNEETIKAIKDILRNSKLRLDSYDQQILAQQNRYNDNQKLLNQYVNEINNLEIQAKQKEANITKIATQLSILTQQKENSSILFKGTKTILDNKAYFGRGLKGMVAELIKVEKDYQNAIDVVLSNATQHIVVDKSETAVKAVNFLKDNNGGRATFIPMTSIAPKSIRDDHLLLIQGHYGFVGVASDLVKVAVEYEIVSRFLLGNIIVATDIEAANRIATILERRYMIATLDGDLIRPGGVIVGGQKLQQQSLLNFEERIKELENILPSLQEALRADSMKISEIKNYRNSALELSRSITGLLNDLNNKKTNEQSTIDSFTLKLKNLTNEEINLEDSTISINSVGADINTLESQRNNLEIESKAIISKLAHLQNDISTYTRSKEECQQMLNSINNGFASKLSTRDQAKLKLEDNRERLASQYKLTLESAESNYVLDMPIEKAEELVRELREEIEKIGNVNLESLEMLVEEEERLNHYSKGEAELSEAKNTLESAIAELDKAIINRLTNILNDVNTEFNNVFHTMFGGGSARLFWSNPNNILDSGVEIEATPPGKNIKNIKLFSGGEKSLIAISLLFAILKARPLPLCILDEVEAALDEANVVRYAEYLQELKDKTQFLVITHRHGTMSRVDQLFGVTMQTRGVSTFFSLELSEAKKLVDDEQKEELSKD